MKKTLAIFLLLLFLFLAWYSWGWYKETVVCCPEEVVEIEYGPLIFDCDSGEVITNDLWPDKRAEIVAGETSGKQLLLVGPYFSGESESAGLARAEKVKTLFAEIPPENILVDSRPAGDCETTKTNMLHELRYKWVTRSDDVIEHLDHTKVFYKFDSDEEITNAATLAYFDELATFLKSSGDAILITGYTDADGEEEYNLELGLKRAQEYKNHLISLGVDETKIAVETKGEADPWKPNDTEENKRLNRRVEIKIID
ncbi:OmpA family protein [Flagellimonas sp. GZD32]|uniref:OmpA family protein n=1 Tax=Flagellimonas cixiensis TaxID=3228750 RepID=UPI0035C88E35